MASLKDSARVHFVTMSPARVLKVTVYLRILFQVIEVCAYILSTYRIVVDSLQGRYDGFKMWRDAL